MNQIRTLDHLGRSASSLIRLDAEDEARVRDRISDIDAEIATLLARKSSLVGNSVNATALLGKHLREAGFAPGEKVAIDGRVFVVTNASSRLLGPEAPSDDEDYSNDDFTTSDEKAEWASTYLESIRIA